MRPPGDPSRPPLRVVLDSRLRTPADADAGSTVALLASQGVVAARIGSIVPRAAGDAPTVVV